MKVVTYATRPYGALSQLMQSYNLFSKDGTHEFKVLGWKSIFNGFGIRMHTYRDYIKTLDPTELVLVIDAYDVLLTGPLNDLQTTFSRVMANEDTTKTILISEEKHTICGHFWASNFTFGNVQGKHLSCGAFMGTASAIKGIMDIVCLDPASCLRTFDDQLAVNNLAKQQPQLFKFDSQWDVFATSNHEDFIVPGMHTGSFCFDAHSATLKYAEKPLFVLHAPGNADMTKTLVKLGYSTQEYLIRKDYGTKLMVYYYRSFWKINLLTNLIGALGFGVVVVLVYKYLFAKKEDQKAA